VAQVHIGNNELQDKAIRNLIIGILWCSPTAIYFILFFTNTFHFDSLLHLAVIIPAAIGSKFISKYKTYSSGIKGEKQTISIIKHLPDGYEAFTSIPISFDGNRTELDMVVVGENGVFIIETKNHNGTIYGSEDDYKFEQHKVGRKGGEYTNTFRNPIKQVKRQTWILSNVLKNKNANAWVQGIVYFSNPNVETHISSKNIPVFDSYNGLDGLPEYLLTYQPKRKLAEGQLDQIKAILSKNLSN
jgi:hypothetical protein